jgi:hypothetical protein
MTLENLERNWQAINAFRRKEPIQVRVGGIWNDYIGDDPEFDCYCWRPKPEPRKPREWWVNMYPKGDSRIHPTLEEAERFSAPARIECVHVREVLEGDQ